MSSESVTSSQLQQQCSICLDPIDAAIRSTARLACGHFFHLDCIGSEFNYRRLMQCPNCRLVEEGEWLFAAGGLQQAIVTDDLDLEDDEDIEDDDDDDDDYFDLTPSMQIYLMQNRLPFPGIGLPPQGIRNLQPVAPGSDGPAHGSTGTQAFRVPQSYGPVMRDSVSITVSNFQDYNGLAHERNVLDVRQNLGRPVHPNPGYITNPQGQAAVGQAHHTCPGPMIHGWPAVFHSQVAQQPQRPVVIRPVPTADAAGLDAAFLSRRGNSARPINLDASTSVGQASEPLPDNAGNVRHLPQQVTGQRMRDRHQCEPSTSTEEYVVNTPYQFL